MKQLHLLVLSTWFLGNVGIHFLNPYLPQIAKLEGSSIHSAQMLISFFLFGKAISMLLWGTFSERYGRRPMMLLALLLFALTSMCLSLPLSIHGMLMLRFMQGMSVGGTLLMGRAMVNDVAKSPVRSFAYLFTFAGFIIPILPLIGAQLALNMSYRHMFLIMSSYPLLVLVFMVVFLPETLVKKRNTLISANSIAIDFFKVTKNTLFLSCLFISAFMVAGESAFNTSASFILIQQMHISKSTYGSVITLLGLSHLVGTFCCAQAVKRFNAYRLIGVGVTCLTLSSTLMALFFHAQTLEYVIFPMVIYYFGTGFIVSTTLVATVKPFPKKKAAALGFSLFLQSMVSGLFSFIVSYAGIHTIKGLALVLLATSFSALFIYSSKLNSERQLLNA